MKKFLSLLLVFSFVFPMFSVVVFAETEEKDMVIRVGETTTAVMKAEQVVEFKSKGYTEEGIKTYIIETVTEFALENGISLTKTEPEVSVMPRASYPPGSITRTRSGSSVATVSSVFPSLGICAINIWYDYDYTAWAHITYQVKGVQVNDDSKVTDSRQRGIFWGEWEHTGGSITYVNDQNAGTCLKVVATGDITHSLSDISMTFEHSFAYLHPVDIDAELGL